MMGKFDDSCYQLRPVEYFESSGGPPDGGWPNLLGCSTPER